MESCSRPNPYCHNGLRHKKKDAQGARRLCNTNLLAPVKAAFGDFDSEDNKARKQAGHQRDAYALSADASAQRTSVDNCSPFR